MSWIVRMVMICFMLADSGWLPDTQVAWAQPVLSTKRTVEDVDIYQDHEFPTRYYYSPPEVKLQTASSGSPAFILLQMRYTGTMLYGDQAQRGFQNILQLSVALQTMPNETFDQIKKTLGTNADLRPLPITRFIGELIIPLGDAAAANEKYRKVTMSGVEASGTGDTWHSFWQERTFTMQLTNEESQLLWDQMETGKLGVSFSYAFYADAMPGTIGNIKASGSDDLTDAVEDIRDEVTFDDKVNTYLVKANTFPIRIEQKDIPNCLKKVDVNEELPPAYAAFEVRCYDFSDDLRPDLLKKIVEIKAYAAAKDYILTKATFSRNTRDISSVIARFPYAIRFDHPLEFRTTEINTEGEKNISPWSEKQNWAEVIDVTTPDKENRIGKKSIDFELDPDSLSVISGQAFTCEVNYSLNGQTVNQPLTWTTGEQQPIKTIQFSYDRAIPIRFRTIFNAPDGSKRISRYAVILPDNDYVYLNIPKQ